jgi:hypothetical protein
MWSTGGAAARAAVGEPDDAGSRQQGNVGRSRGGAKGGARAMFGTRIVGTQADGEDVARGLHDDCIFPVRVCVGAQVRTQGQAPTSAPVAAAAAVPAPALLAHVSAAALVEAVAESVEVAVRVRVMVTGTTRRQRQRRTEPEGGTQSRRRRAQGA